MQIDENGLFHTPDGKTYDLKEIHTAESRVAEIAFITPTKSAELLSTFNRALFTLSRYYTEVSHSYRKSSKAVADRAAVLTIDVIPSVITVKKLANNAETRTAIMSLDAEYSKLQEKELELEAAALFLKRKIEDFESALSTGKRVLQDNEVAYRNPNYNVSQTNSINNRPVTTTPNGLKIGTP